MKRDDLGGDEQKRFCSQCNKHVHNLSAMDDKSIEQLFGSGQSVCARIERRAKRQRPSVSGVSRRHWLSRLTGLATSIALLFAIGGCSDMPDRFVTGEAIPPDDESNGPWNNNEDSNPKEPVNNAHNHPDGYDSIMGGAMAPPLPGRRNGG